MTWLPAAVVGVPLTAAGITMFLGRRALLQRIVTFGAVGFVVVAALVLVGEVDATGPVVAQVGAWDAPFGITLVVDRFSAIVLAISALMLLAVLAHASSQLGAGASEWWFPTKYLALTAGVAMSLVTGDLFNLFVAFEVMLVASYVLLTVRSRDRELRAAMSYVVVNLVASALFLMLIAATYGLTGTVNFADLAVRIAELDEGARRGLQLMMLGVFGIKAGLFPLFMWLPDSYPTAPTPVTAIFAALLTKVGVFVIVRTQTLLFPDDQPSRLILFVAGATMFVGVLGAIAQNDMKRILSFHIVSQIGYMVMGLGFLSVAGLAAAIVYIVHHIVVKTGLFLVTDLVEEQNGSASLEGAGGLIARRPILAVAFAPLALSLAGIPPFSGFVAKFALVREGLALDRGLVVTVSLAVGLLTLYSMSKIWSSIFWGSADRRSDAPRLGAVLATGAVAVLSLGVAFGAGPLAELAQRAAADLLDPSVYIAAVTTP